MTTHAGSILVVEDDHASLQLLEVLLSKEGYQVRPADNGELALASVAAHPPELILLDIQMPVMDGFEVIRRLKAREETRDIPVIFLSGAAETEKRTAGFEMGAVDFISKPFHNKELLVRVHTHLELSRLRKRLEQQTQDLMSANSLLEKDLTERKQAEISLQVSEARFRDLFNCMTSGVAVYKAIDNGGDFIFMDFNPAAEKIEKVSRKDILGKRVTEVFPGVKAFGVFEVFQRVWRTGKLEYFPQNIYKDERDPGSWRESWIFKLSTGEIVSIYNDVTERKQSEQALIKSEVFRNSLLENAPNPVMVTNPDFVITYVNPALEKLTGYSRSELIGRGLPYPYWPVKDHEAYSKAIKWNSRNGIFKLERCFCRKNGEPFWIEANSTPVIDGEQIKHHIYNWVDITERKQEEEKLRESEKFRQTLMEKSPYPVVVRDPNGCLIYVNPAFEKLTGFSATEVIGTNTPAPWWPEKDLLGIREMDRVHSETDWKKAEAPMMKKNGEIFWTEVTSGPILQYGQLKYVVSNWVDITERKQAEARIVELEALKIINEAKSDLLANVSHELRTPLTTIKGNIETLLSTDIKWSQEQQIEFLQAANKEADHLTLLIKDLLDMSRLDSGKLTLDKRSYQVSEILDSASGVLSVITARHKLKTLQVTDLPPVDVDKVKICQVITNLVENAAKFSPEGSQIEIEAKLYAGNVIISIEDHGIGMPPEVVAKLFDRFYQSYQVVEGKTHGTGLGLSICKGIIEAHGGNIWVESQPGKGSKFIFSLPLS